MKCKIYQYLAGALLFIVGAGKINAQGFHCGTLEAMQELLKDHPEVLQQHDELLKNSLSQSKLQQPNSLPPSLYIIPVVFHIVHQYGSENISDAQVQDEVNILNRDYRKMNADTATVTPSFQSLIADIKVEFRLATKDPQGNCTNGIVRYYSHKTNQANDKSKIDPWPRDKYLNVWVVRTIGSVGVAGYAYYPSSVTGVMFTVDGVIILHDYIGSIGTGSVGTSRALTHEIGHYLNLAHCWGSTNQPGVACGDDGIGDTPRTKGWSWCPGNPNLAKICDTAIVENWENYMEYSYCSKMFTVGQRTAMQQALNSAISSRNNLWTYSNHVTTGTDTARLTANPYLFPPILGSLPVCKPVADFSENRMYICQGGSVTFTDQSWRSPVTSRSWSIPNGTPNTSTAANPTITFNTWGWQDVTLTATNSAGSDTKLWHNAVFVAPPWYDYFGTFSEGFENNNFPSGLWIVENMENSYPAWTQTSQTASSGSNCVKLEAFGTDALLVDAFISPSYNLSTCSGTVTLNFKYSCATTATTSANITETLKIYTSTNCGQTWTIRKTITGSTLANAGYSPTGFIPNSQSLWASAQVTLSPLDLTPNTRFRFEYTSSAYSNNIYIDDINLQATTVGIGGVQNYFFGLNVYPNPSNGNNLVNISYALSSQEKIKVSLIDMIGREVVVVNNEVQSAGEKLLTIDKNTYDLKAGVYLVKISNGTSYDTRKLVITN